MNGNSCVLCYINCISFDWQFPISHVTHIVLLLFGSVCFTNVGAYGECFFFIYIHSLLLIIGRICIY